MNDVHNSNDDDDSNFESNVNFETHRNLFEPRGLRFSRSISGNNWTNEMAVNLRDYAYKSNMYSWQTGQDAFYWNRFGRKLIMWSSVLSLVATLGFGPILGLVDNPDLRWLFYVITVINLLLVLSVAILNNMHLIYNITTKIVEHLEKSAKFGALYRRIKDQFYMPVKIRYNAKTLLDFVSERYNELTSEKLFIRPATQNNWDEQITRTNNGDIDYDAILLLPIELRNPFIERQVNDVNNVNDVAININ